VTGTPPTTGTANLGVRITDALGRTATATVPISVRTGCEGAGAALQTQCLALVDLYRSTNGSGWLSSTGWLTGNPCTVPWEGITCDGSVVTAIELDGRSLTGALPDMSALTGLTLLDLRDNLIEGSIANAVALPALASLSLDENSFTGVIPADLWTKDTLTDIDLADNAFTAGDIPAMVDLPNLLTLNLASTGRTGPIPAELWTNSDLLTSVDLSDNNFDGGIAASIGGLGSLQDLNLGDNPLLGGQIPDEFLQLAPPPDGTGVLAGLTLNGSGCFTTNMNVALEAFLTSLDPEWNIACTP
jgi:hypothetical protein